MTSPIGFTVKDANVVHETIDGETVIFHLQTGVYYSLTGPGVEVDLLREGHGINAITAHLAGRYAAPRDDIEVAVVKLVSDLEQEDLIDAGPAAALEPVAVAPEFPHLPFEAPVLKKYDDMQDLLLIDPIHDVEETQGWPVKKAEAS